MGFFGNLFGSIGRVVHRTIGGAGHVLRKIGEFAAPALRKIGEVAGTVSGAAHLGSHLVNMGLAAHDMYRQHAAGADGSAGASSQGPGSGPGTSAVTRPNRSYAHFVG